MRPTTPKANDERWLASRPPLRGSFSSDAEEHNTREHKHNTQGHDVPDPSRHNVLESPLCDKTDTKPEHNTHKCIIKIIRHNGTTSPYPVHEHQTQTPDESENALTAQAGIPKPGSEAPQRSPSSSMDVDAENENKSQRCRKDLDPKPQSVRMLPVAEPDLDPRPPMCVRTSPVAKGSGIENEHETQRCQKDLEPKPPSVRTFPFENPDLYPRPPRVRMSPVNKQSGAENKHEIGNGSRWLLEQAATYVTYLAAESNTDTAPTLSPHPKPAALTYREAIDEHRRGQNALQALLQLLNTFSKGGLKRK